MFVSEYIFNIQNDIGDIQFQNDIEKNQIITFEDVEKTVIRFDGLIHGRLIHIIETQSHSCNPHVIRVTPPATL